MTIRLPLRRPTSPLCLLRKESAQTDVSARITPTAPADAEAPSDGVGFHQDELAGAHFPARSELLGPREPMPTSLAYRSMPARGSVIHHPRQESCASVPHEGTKDNIERCSFQCRLRVDGHSLSRPYRCTRTHRHARISRRRRSAAYWLSGGDGVRCEPDRPWTGRGQWGHPIARTMSPGVPASKAAKVHTAYPL